MRWALLLALLKKKIVRNEAIIIMAEMIRAIEDMMSEGDMVRELWIGVGITSYHQGFKS